MYTKTQTQTHHIHIYIFTYTYAHIHVTTTVDKAICNQIVFGMADWNMDSRAPVGNSRDSYETHGKSWDSKRMFTIYPPQYWR